MRLNAFMLNKHTIKSKRCGTTCLSPSLSEIRYFPYYQNATWKSGKRKEERRKKKEGTGCYKRGINTYAYLDYLLKYEEMS